MSIQLDYKGNKGFRLLAIYERLNKGELLEKSALAESYGVTLKTIQRDIDDLRSYLADNHQLDGEIAIKYDKSKNGYYLVRFEREWLTNEEVLALCKILLESRAFEKNELKSLIDKLLSQVTPKDKATVEQLIRYEQYNYVPLRHNKKLLKPIWELSGFIAAQNLVQFSYVRKDGATKEHLVKPVAIMFSEFYFYLVCFMADDSKPFPTIFRIDRISDIKGTKEKFSVPYKDRFDDGEFRKRVQFMFSGELKRIIFEYSGQSIEAVLDRLPTAEIINEKQGIYRVRAEVYGDGIYMWLRSQGEMVKIIRGKNEV